MSPEELPGRLREIRDRVASSAAPCVMAVADAYQDHLTTVTLRRYGHPAGTKTDSPPGQPPAYVGGALARSVTSRLSAGGGVWAQAITAPHTIYARIQETGGDIYPVRARFLRWTEDGVTHYSRHVYLPPRPYMRPAAVECIANGSLTRADAASFMAVVWG